MKTKAELVQVLVGLKARRLDIGKEMETVDNQIIYQSGRLAQLIEDEQTIVTLEKEVERLNLEIKRLKSPVTVAR